MKIIKLDAIDSTNTFLKELCHKNDVENLTVVVADNQTGGRGQMQSSWESEKGKNLMFSILIRFPSLEIDNQFYISKVISLAIQDTLASILDKKISIKWPNDILAERKKICGVLIENSVKKSRVHQSIVGIGLNVNQEVFNNLPNATSMKLVSNEDYLLDDLLETLVGSIKKYVAILNDNHFHKIDTLYLDRLHKMNRPSMFKNMLTSSVFMGKIMGVSKQGQLKIELEDETISQFNLKEIEFIK
jgi:BirA family biotin operon repressor/biotin-[acetyl-CoA-carboxylase] ligase